ncbi:MAG TPA: XrtA/PEP-CTERM system histidine kinase PrsK [Allosphingosinicella sp.]|nr:XrtA/PEP-CTERM system histidine kinase PrsK [Allosphingosinicella sp.]
MTGFVALWSHLLAAALYGALAVHQLRRWHGDAQGRPLITAFAAMSVWTIFLALLGPYNFLAQLAESGRNLAFLAFMYGLLAGAEEGGSQRAVKAVFAAVAAVIGLQIVVGGVMPEFARVPLVLLTLASTSQVIGLVIAAGALILVHNLYGQAAPGSRSALRFPMLALAGMWAYDLHLYTIAYFTRVPGLELFALRGLALAALALPFALGVRNASWKIQISRAATFQSVSLVVILFYLVVMMLAARAMEIVGGDWARIGQVGIVFVTTLGALVLLPSAKLRAWLRVVLTKHLFEHRYDYRGEWLRFTDTVGRQSETGASLEERVVKALADIAGSPAGLLLLADESGRLSPGGRWNWAGPLPAGEGAEALLRYVEGSGFVIDFDAIRRGWLVRGDARIPVPAWLATLAPAWAGIPLIHGGRLAGLVILEHPSFRRALDWEDFDLFRTAGIQAASYIAEARSHQALADARRFDEFNRRFAFIMHDIKNLVSQLSLVARNAERHADNPDFRADMIATLQSSVRKMNELLARLSPGAAREAEPARPVAIGPLLDALAAARRRVHPVRVGGDSSLVAKADPAGLEQALGHLVQNAIEASGEGEPVELSCFESGGDVAIEVVDRGAGMSPAFVRDRLFQPFVSTKESGFGIGAYEARSLILAMGGRLDVESAEGDGTRFTIYLPADHDRSGLHYERMRA